MPRYIVTGRRRDPQPWGAGVYLSKNGLATHDAGRAAVIDDAADAREEREHADRVLPAWAWTVEELPAGLPLAAAALRAKPIDAK